MEEEKKIEGVCAVCGREKELLFDGELVCEKCEESGL